MADDITLNSGSGGDTIAADDVAGVKYPIQKTAFGALDSVTLAASGAGAVSAGVQRMTLASDDPAVALLGTMDADTSTLAGAVSGTEMQVDVVTSALPTGAATAAKQPALGTAGTASTDVITVQGIASMTALVVDGSGVTQPVSGTVTANLSATDNTVLDNIDADTSAIQTAVELIDDAIKADDAAFTPATTKVMMAGFEFDDTLPDVVDEGDAGAARMSARREIYTQIRDAAGNERGLNVDANGAIGVTNAGLTELAAAINASSQMDVNIAASSATVTVDLGANNDVTVTGTVDLGATDNAVLDDIAAKLGTIDADTSALFGTVSGTEVQVDVVAALPAGTNAIGKLAANSGVDIGDVDVLSIAAGTNNIGNVGLIPRTSGGMTIFRSIDIDESEEEVKATAGQLFSISAFNTTAAPLYLKFYNLTAANTTVGTSTPVLTFVVPGNADSDGAGFVWNNEIGFAFSTAISVACTTGVADADTGAPGANACIINLGYA